MTNCEWFGKFPFCKQCRKQNKICLSYAIYIDQNYDTPFEWKL